MSGSARLSVILTRQASARLIGTSAYFCMSVKTRSSSLVRSKVTTRRRGEEVRQGRAHRAAPGDGTLRREQPRRSSRVEAGPTIGPRPIDGGDRGDSARRWRTRHQRGRLRPSPVTLRYSFLRPLRSTGKPFTAPTRSAMPSREALSERRRPARRNRFRTMSDFEQWRFRDSDSRSATSAVGKRTVSVFMRRS